jgi:DNA modification methylase
VSIDLICGNCAEELMKLPEESIDCCITSPPYWGLRNYGIADQFGLEKTPEEYTEKMVYIFRKVWRLLKNEGTLWLNLGDSYAGGGRGCNTPKQQSNRGTQNMPDSIIPPGLKRKDLVGIPWRVAFALQADGWYLRQDLIWHKPNPMPESVTDRCTKAHEYIFLLAKSQKYYFDNEAIKENTLTRDNSNRNRDITKLNNTPGRSRMAGLKTNNYELHNRRSVWTISTKPFKGAHFATFPEDLILPCVLAGCPKGGTILDPFSGAGTTGVVAKKNNRNFIGIELNPTYVKMAQQRIDNTVGSLFATEVARRELR